MGKSRAKRHGAFVDQFWLKFSPDELAEVCARDEETFGEHYGMQTVVLDDIPGPENYYHFKDNGADILAVAHLDTVVQRDERSATFVNTHAGPVVFSGALDDRLGAYIILELLPKLGINVDVLLTVGEESGRSTAEHFETEKDYRWIIEFDRGGTDVVLYQYDDEDTRALVSGSGARVAIGAFSDISYMEHLGRKAFNWGVGYEDYHGPRGHAFLEDTAKMVGHFLEFWKNNSETTLPHVKTWGTLVQGGSRPRYGGGSFAGGLYGYGSYDRWADGWDDEEDKTAADSALVFEGLDDGDELPPDVIAELDRQVADDDEAFHAWLMRQPGQRRASDSSTLPLL